MTLQDLSQNLDVIALIAVSIAIVVWAAWPERRDPFRETLRQYERRIAEARKRHKPIRHIEAERQAFVTACLRGQG